MSTKRKKVNWGTGIGGFVILIIIFISIMTWFYPFSPFSVNKSYSFTPKEVLHNGKTYEEELSEFKAAYEEDLKKDLEGDNYNPTVDRTQYVLPIFEQEWIIGTDSKSLDKDELDRMLFDVEQARETLLDLVSEGNYNKEEKGYLVDNIKSFLSLEESIRYIRDGKYFSRSELQTLFGNLRGDFRTGFEFYTTIFYDRSHK
ncbi:hypothetical protein EU245_11070 [Lentibacillus lipolyticus]|nr:hypothetical protein EU245_11070 [Lentibacillus lipolyticus]